MNNWKIENWKSVLFRCQSIYVSPHTQMILKTLQVYIFTGWTDSHNYRPHIFIKQILMFWSNIYLVVLLLKETIYKKRISNNFFLHSFFFDLFPFEFKIHDSIILLHFSFKTEKNADLHYFFVLFLACISISLLDFVCICIFSLVHNSKVRKVLYKA